MGQCAEMMVNGECCQMCGQINEGEALGFPYTCEECGDDEMKNKNKQQRRALRVKKRKQDLMSSFNKKGWTELSEYHFRKGIKGLAFDFWPTTQKAMYNGQVFKQVIDVNELVKAIEKGEFK